MKLPKELRCYLQAAPFPHLTSIKLSLLIGVAGSESFFWMLKTHHSTSDVIMSVVTSLLAWGVVLCQADAFSRYCEFKRMLRLLNRYGYRPALFRPLSTSRCQRDAALLAARETGHGVKAKGLFQKMGYRWYHIVPDSILDNPLAFFHPSFLRTTFIPSKKM